MSVFFNYINNKSFLKVYMQL